MSSIRFGEFRGLTDARAGTYAAACARGEHKIEAAHQGPLGVADIETKNDFIAKPWGMRLLQTRCHVLGVGDTRCTDKELRQWRLCVTFSGYARIK